MNFLVLVTSELRHNWVRSATTILCVCAAFALFGVVQGVKDSFDSALHDLSQSADRLLVASRVSRMDPLPIAHATKLRAIPGVQAVSPTAYLLAYYQEPGKWVGGHAVDIEHVLSVFRFKVDPEVVRRMQATRTGAIVGTELAKRYGWKAGDRIPLTSNLWQNSRGSQDWAFDILGTYAADDPREAEGLLINYSYFDEERAFGKGGVASFWVRVARAPDANKVAARIDDAFLNSSGETLTQSGKELTFNRMRQLGDIELIVRSIVGATLVLVFFVTGNTLRQTSDERLPEFGVLRATGFSGTYISLLVIADAFVLIALGAAAGLVIAAFLVTQVPEQFGAFTIGPATLGSAALAVIALSLATAALPAYRATSLPIVAALRRER